MGNFRSIQFLRFVAAFLVVLSHADYLYTVHAGTSDATAAYLFAFGAVGVHIFFVISGFVMVISTFGSSRTMSWSTFLFRRFVRIYPAYWLYALAFIALLYLRGGSLTLENAIKSLLLVPGYSSLIIGQGWTLSYEVYFYICFAACIWLGMARALTVLSAVFLASIALRRFLPMGIGAFDVISNSLLLEFIFGAGIAAAIESGFRMSAKVSTTLLALSLLAYAAGSIIGYSRLPSVIMWGLPSAGLVLSASMVELDRRLPSVVRHLAWLGDSSYSLYLLHPLFLLLILAPLGVLLPTSAADRIALCFAASAVCSTLSILAFKAIENPITKSLRWKRAADGPIAVVP